MIELYLYATLLGASVAASGGMAIKCYFRNQNIPVEAADHLPREHHLEDVIGDIVEEQMAHRPGSNNSQIKINIKTNNEDKK